MTDVYDEILELLPDTVDRQQVKRELIARLSGKKAFFGYSLLKSERNMALMEAVARGDPVQSITRRYQVSRSTFYRIVKRYQQQEPDTGKGD